MSAIDAVAGMVASSSRITVLTGAGISTDSGIPDFRGPNGEPTPYDEDAHAVIRESIGTALPLIVAGV